MPIHSDSALSVEKGLVASSLLPSHHQTFPIFLFAQLVWWANRTGDQRVLETNAVVHSLCSDLLSARLNWSRLTLMSVRKRAPWIPATCQSQQEVFVSLSLITQQEHFRDGCYHPHFTDEVTEAQGNTFPKSPTNQTWRVKFRSSGLQGPCPFLSHDHASASSLFS